ncbi:hypothetical protein BC941DRAFT_470602 [Chlamydoabsidia padenii]|nr:hypothetical protein BC941DRAFT_470602 [Chlamydoabsidia padenii]
MDYKEGDEGTSDPTDLPPTVPYDYQSSESPPSTEPLLTANTIVSPPRPRPSTTTTTADGAAPHDHSSFESIDPTSSSFDSDSNSNSYDYIDTTYWKTDPDKTERTRVQKEAAEHLFRCKTENWGHDSDDFFNNNKRKLGYMRSEQATSQYHLKRGLSDLVRKTDWSQLPKYLDVPRSFGRIDHKQRRYLEDEIDLDKLIASLDSSMKSTLDTDPDSVERSLHIGTPLMSSSLDYHHLSSGNSYIALSNSPTPSPTAPTQIQPSAAATVTRNDNLTYYEDNHDIHLQNYSPERMDDFTSQVSLQPSSTPIRAHIPSSFPEEDLEIFKQSIEQSGSEDTYSFPTDEKKTMVHLTSRRVSEMPSPFLEEPKQQQHETGSTTHDDHNEAAVVPSNRSLRQSGRTPRFWGYHIMFATSIDHQPVNQYRRTVEAMGATIVFDTDTCTHLVSDGRRTSSFLCALARQKYIVSEDWVKDSISKGRFQDETPYVLATQTRPNYFTNKKLYFDPSSTIAPQKARDLIKAAKAKHRLVKPDLENIDQQLIVISENKQPYEDAGYETFSSDRFIELYEHSSS